MTYGIPPGIDGTNGMWTDIFGKYLLRKSGIKFVPKIKMLKNGSRIFIESNASVKCVQLDISGDLKIGAYSYIRSGCKLMNISEIGRFCSISNDSILGMSSHLNHVPEYVTTYPLIDPENAEKSAPLKIGNDVLIGNGSFIFDGLLIGTEAIIGARAVVTKDVPSYAIVAGNPARIIGYRHNDEIIRGLLDSRWWELDVNEIKKSPLTAPARFVEIVKTIDLLANYATFEISRKSIKPYR